MRHLPVCDVVRSLTKGAFVRNDWLTFRLFLIHVKWKINYALAREQSGETANEICARKYGTEIIVGTVKAGMVYADARGAARWIILNGMVRYDCQIIPTLVAPPLAAHMTPVGYTGTAIDHLPGTFSFLGPYWPGVVICWRVLTGKSQPYVHLLT